MKGNDEKLVKQRIRERYKGVSEDILDVIPAKPREDFYKPETIKRVAVYAVVRQIKRCTIHQIISGSVAIQ